MTNNDIFRQLRYILNLSDQQVVETFLAADMTTTTQQVKQWLINDEDKQLFIQNSDLSYFLDGLININRGRRKDYKPTFNSNLTNNEIFKKLKIALNLKDTDLLDIFKLVNVDVGKHELSAFFRSPGKGQYQEMGNQYMRNFLHGLQVKLRPSTDDSADDKKN